MKRNFLVSSMTAGLVFLLAGSGFAAVNAGVPNPYPTRDSKVLADFEDPTAVTVTADPLGTGENRASISSDAQFAADGSHALKIDETGAAADGHNHFTLTFPQPVDIKGYQVLSMDIFIPDASINDSWYQFQPVITTTNADDDTQTTDTGYGPGNLHKGWNHMIWSLRTGTDTKLVRIAAGNSSGDVYLGPLYVDNIRIYKGNFVGLQPDEKLVMGFEKPSDKDLFTTVGTDTSGNDLKVGLNTDKKYVTEGNDSLLVDLTGQPQGWTSSVARADDWGTTIDASKATAIHVDFYIPSSSFTASSYHELGFGVVGDGGEVWGDSNYVPLDQWVTMERVLKPEEAANLKNIKGLFFITNSGADWTGPIYVDALRVVVPAQ